MQWKLPPPVRMWSARRPIATRSGKRAWTTSTAARSLAAPYCGTTTDGVADVEVHVAGRDHVAVLVEDSAGRGKGDDVEPRRRTQPARSVAIDRFVRDRPAPAVGMRDAARARRTARGCRRGRRCGRSSGPRRARPRARSRGRRCRRCSTSSRVSGLRLGLSRHCSVVSDGARAVAVDRAAFEDPACLGERKSSALGKPLADVLVAFKIVFAAPAIEGKARGRRRFPGTDDDRPSVAQPDVAERLDDDFGERRTAGVRFPLRPRGRRRAAPSRPCRRHAPPRRTPRPRARPP